ncbi:MAG TPA: twin transmembrane helix small protein [Woeseiaceae bacterium]|nr:twin transmembrane helix small protein [Woeseiaceae bacterium]
MKLLVLALLLAIVFSLGSALFFLYRDPEGSTRMLTALKFRVALSVALIVLLVVGYQLGWIHA